MPHWDTRNQWVNRDKDVFYAAICLSKQPLHVSTLKFMASESKRHPAALRACALAKSDTDEWIPLEHANHSAFAQGPLSVSTFHIRRAETLPEHVTEKTSGHTA